MLVVAQAPIVGEMAVARVGVPGGHPLFQHGLANPAGPLPCVFVGQERTDRSLPAGDIPGTVSGRSGRRERVSQRRAGSTFAHTFDQTADGFGFGRGDRLASQLFIERAARSRCVGRSRRTPTPYWSSIRPW